MDGIKRAGLHAVAEAQTAEGTGLGPAAGNQGHGGAGVHAGILILVLCVLTGPVAADKGNLTFLLFRFHAHDGGNLLGNGSAANRTLIDRGLAVGNRLGAAGAAGETAAATVVAGQGGKDFLFLGVCLHLELLGNEGQEEAKDTARRTDEHD